MPYQPSRPICPKCGMRMIATAPVKDSKQTVECLRCGQVEQLPVKVSA